MTGRYGKTFSRKKAATPPPIEEFDAIVSDNASNTNRASATKTAGHVGKWGTAVFTSMRQTHFNGGFNRDEGGGTKRPAPSESPPLDQYSYRGIGCDPPNGASKPQQTYKPRKFFKSRNAEPKPEPKADVYSASKGLKSDSHTDRFSSSERDSNHGKVSSSQDTLFDKLVNSNKPNTNSGGAKSGSGIKLKIFKSRNEASSSQDTYSSTIELPSDDSRANSTSNSVSSSPSYKDFNDDSLDTPEPVTDFIEQGTNSNSVKTLETKTMGTNSNSVKTLETKTIVNKDSLSVPDNKTNFNNISLDSTLDSSLEFMGYINQTTGLPLCDDNDTSLNVQKTPSEIKPVKRSYGSKAKKPFSKSKELNKYLNQNAITSSVVDSEELINDSVCSGTLSEDFDPLGVSNSFVETPLEIPPLNRSDSPVVSSGSVESGEEEGHDLFSVDFDENDIQDRTIDDISVPDENKNSPSTQSDTQDDDLLFTMTEASRSTYKTFKRSSSNKSISESPKKVEEKPPAIVKKRSIFKSRNKATGSGEEKKKATYKHKWHDHDENEDPDKKEGTSSYSHHSSSQGSSNTNAFDDFDFDAPSTLKRVQTWPGATTNLDDSMEDNSSVTSVKCAKGAKQYYTVIKNVKRIHQLQEAGEFQEFNDDVEYFLEALRPSAPINTRCLAALNLAQKCMVPSFRMHLRAHGIVIKFFRALSNSAGDHRLAQCSAMVMFALSQDRLNMDLDRESLELMLNLLDCDETAQLDDNTDVALVKQNRKKIRELCRDMQKKGHAKHLHLDNITAGKLSMETLLSLTSKRAGEWFKEELRELGGMDHLVRTMTQCAKLFTPEMETWTKPLLEKLSKVDRCLKVLENVTHQNVDNQEYLLTLQEGIFPQKLLQMLRMCRIEVPLYPTMESKLQKSINGTSCGELLAQNLITILKVLVNITYGSRKEAMGSKLLGAQDDVYEITLYCLLILPKYLEHDNAFEVQVLSCCLLLNLIEHSQDNRKRLMTTSAPDTLDADDNIFGGRNEKKSAMTALVELFYRSEEAARHTEVTTDNLIDNDLAKKTNADDEEKKDEEIEETVTKLLKKAGHHMEETLIAAYSALVTGYCIMDGEEVEEEIRAMQPNGNYKLMVAVLKKFLEFMNLTATTTLIKSLGPTKRVMKYMEKLDLDPAQEAEEERKRQEAKEREFEAFGF